MSPYFSDSRRTVEHLIPTDRLRYIALSHWGLDTPHLPHGWETGYLMEARTKTLFCGDLFTQGGDGSVAVTEGDILEPSEAFRIPLDYFSHSTHTRSLIEKLAQEDPTTLACMHGSAWTGNGAGLLRALGERLMRDGVA